MGLADIIRDQYQYKYKSTRKYLLILVSIIGLMLCLANIIILLISMHLPTLTPKEIYSLNTHTGLGGIEGYHVQKKYFDPKQSQDKSQKQVKKHVTKRGNYLQDEEKIHKIIPGPGQYSKSEQWPEKRKVKLKYADKQTYVDDIIKNEKKQKKPAPGQYNVAKTLEEEQESAKKLASKKTNPVDRISYLDEVEYEAIQTPGVGNYYPRLRAFTQASYTQSHSRLKPEDWKKKHELLQKKKPPKSPDPVTYNPTRGNSALFQNISTKRQNKNFLGKVQRFKTSSSGSGLNPAKYAVVQEWRGKEGKKVAKHGLEVLSRPSPQSVYYH